MAIFRGIGGSGEANDSGTLDSVTEQAQAAASSATDAASSATDAATSATEAAASATSASSSATSASTSSTSASTSATAAATSATSAASSATSAASSATSASTAQTAAETAQAAAETAQTAAETAETNAATSATSASTSATNAATSATAAATSATSASTSATNAATSETNAATSESNAASSATSAASAQSAAEAARDSALAAYDSFDDRYLGVKTSDPSLDNDGNALIAGTLYFNSTDEKMKLYTGSSWVDAYTTGAGFLQISSNLSDLDNAATARTNLGLGTAATTASTDYATAAQGALADSAVQPTDNVSDLTNDAGYITGNQTITLSGDASGSGTTSIVVTVADDSHNHVISNIDGLQTALDGKQATGDYVVATGDTMTGDLSFGDNVKATFGAGSDLQIYHDGSNSVVADAGAGELRLAGTNLRLTNAAQTGTYFNAIDGAEAQLWYNNFIRLATTATGIDVTGTVVSDGLTVDTDTIYVDSTNHRVGINTTSPNVGLTVNGTASTNFLKVGDGRGNNPNIRFDDSDTSNNAEITLDNTAIRIEADEDNSVANSEIIFRVDGSERMTIDSNGDIDFYDSVGTSKAFHWDAADERLGIGTTSPSGTLSLDSDGSSQSVITTSGDGATYANLEIGGYSGTPSIKRQITFHTNDALGSRTERMRIDSSGNLLVGTTDSTFYGTGNSEGVGAFANGVIAGSRNGDCANFNRITTDGDIVVFRKDGTNVGSIGAYLNDLVIGTTDTNIRFFDAEDRLLPVTSSGASSDGNTSLGRLTHRFKDLYLSGGVYLGGTGSANHLDDYEEGTWTPTSQNAGTTSFAVAKYLKIGNQVTLWVDSQSFSDSTSSSNVEIGGLPFNPAQHAQGSVICNERDDTTTVVPFVGKSTDDVSFYANSVTGSFAQRKHNDFIETTGTIYWTITYLTS